MKSIILTKSATWRGQLKPHIAHDAETQLAIKAKSLKKMSVPNKCVIQQQVGLRLCLDEKNALMNPAIQWERWDPRNFAQLG